MFGLRRPTQRVAVCVVFVGTLFITIMDASILNVVVPTLGRDFDVPIGSVDAVIIAYLVSLSVCIPASGWLGDRFGARRVLLLAIVVFTVASTLCGLAGSLGELVVYRVLQGAGGGMLTPVGLAMLYRTFPPEERVRIASILTVPTALAPALGPVLGGVLVTDLSWRWVFYVNVPIGAVAWVFGYLFVNEQREDEAGRFDAAGFALAGAGFGALMYGLCEGPSRGWGTPAILGTVSGGLLLLGVLVRVELRRVRPMLDFRILTDRLFRTGTVVVTLTMISLYGVIYLAALFFQFGLGMSALDSGLSTFPESIGVMIGSQIVSRLLYPTFGPRRLMAAGFLGLAVVVGSMALVTASTSVWVMRVLLALVGYSVSHIMVSTQAASFATVPQPSMGRASTLFNAQRQLGGAVGVALMSTVVSLAGATTGALGAATSLTGYHAAFLTAAAVAILGAVVSLRVRDSDAALTITGRPRRVLLADQPAATVVAEPGCA
jgi:EmrB/QacA subfamily drug resistance transporter